MGSKMSETGWKEIINCIITLHKMRLLPIEIYNESEGDLLDENTRNIYTQLINANVNNIDHQREEKNDGGGGIFSWMFGGASTPSITTCTSSQSTNCPGLSNAAL